MRKFFAKSMVGVGLTLGTVFTVDHFCYYSRLGRSVKTMYVAGAVALDYKLNFKKENLSDIENLHARTAQKIYNLCRDNGGLYIKYGQQIATVPVLPPAYVKLFKQLFDDAPSHSFEIVKVILEREYQKPLDEIFSSFSENAVASASIAQVHKAVLRETGQTVAVKVQKPEIQIQMEADLFIYQTLMWAIEKYFTLPGLYHSAVYISDNLRQETDFIHEGKNSEKCFDLLQHSSKNLKDSVYVPKVDWELTTKVAMVQEWIEGTSFGKPQELEKKNYNLGNLMNTIVSLFADQIFRTGFIHCDPHPGNIIIRDIAGKPQIVLLDHGLYIQSQESFRESYCKFWISMFTLDYETLNSVAKEWGIPDISLFATATLSKPWKEGQLSHLPSQTKLTDAFDAHIQGKERLIDFLKNLEQMPKELMFVGRNMNIVRANNKALGSPVNRINIMANYAAKSVSLINSQTYFDYYLSKYNSLKFKSILFIGSLAFYFSRVLHVCKLWLGMKDQGFEGLLDDQLKKRLEQEFPGIVIDDSLFDS
jgi:aarF domain-containing kinase